VVQVLLSYTVKVTVPPAWATLVPARVAASVTAVPVGTEMEAPFRPPPTREVLTVTGVVIELTVSTSDPQVLVEGELVESPE
jgi:hypothetical protein